jgi:ABC-type phosphate transport system substrate-binding protein
MKHWLLLGMAFILAACGSPAIATPAPTPEAIQITYPTSLQKWMDNLARCAADYPQVALYVNQANIWIGNLSQAEAALEFAQLNTETSDFYLTQLGWEQLVVVVNQENTLSKLPTDRLTAIFSGQTSKWLGASSLPIQVWVLPEGDPVRTLFDRIVMRGRSVSSEARLSPDAAAMLEAVANNANSIGYLPASWVNSGDSAVSGKVKIVQLEDSLASQLQQPIVAVTQNEPVGPMREILVCLTSHAP